MRSSMVWEYDFSYSTSCYVVNCRFLSRVTARRSSHLRMPGLLLPAFSDGFMACRFNRSIPAHSIPVPPSLRGLFSPSPRFLPSLAFPLPWACGLPCSVLVGASSVRFQLSAGICRAVFAFPVRREDSVSNGKKFVNLFFVKWQIIFKYKKAPFVSQRGLWVLNSNIT